VYKYKVASLEKTAYEKQQLVIEQKQAIESGLLKQAELKALNLKKVSEVTSLKAQVRILIDSIKHTGKVVVVNPCDSTDTEWQNALYLPVSFVENTKYYNLSGTMDENANLSLDLKLPVSLDVFTGWDRKLKSYKAVVTSDNPHFIVSEIRSLKVEVPKPKKLGIGFQIGYGVTKQGLSPVISVGLNYNLFTF
jgi:hypothetical protein